MVPLVGPSGVSSWRYDRHLPAYCGVFRQLCGCGGAACIFHRPEVTNLEVYGVPARPGSDLQIWASFGRAPIQGEVQAVWDVWFRVPASGPGGDVVQCTSSAPVRRGGGTARNGEGDISEQAGTNVSEACRPWMETSLTPCRTSAIGLMENFHCPSIQRGTTLRIRALCPAPGRSARKAQRRGSPSAGNRFSWYAQVYEPGRPQAAAPLE